MFNIKKRCPPGPSLFSLTSEGISSRLDYYTDLRDEFGDIVRVPNIVRAYLINDPECLKYILKQKSDNYIKGGTAALALKKTLGHGILVNNGTQWRKRRKMTAPYFHPKNLPRFIPYIHEFTQDRLSYFQKFIDNDEAFDISYEMMAIVFRIAAKALYQEDVSEKSLEKIIHAIGLENKFSTTPLVFVPFFPSLNGINYWRARRYLRKYLNKIIKNRQKNPSPEASQDLLDILCSGTMADNLTPLSEQAIFDEVKTFLMTGHETTGSALSWTMYLLAKNPQAQLKIRSEVKEVLKDGVPQYEDIEQLKYTRMVFEEALRLYPPIWMTGRKVVSKDFLQDYYIKAKSEVYVCPYTMHRHPKYWPEPDEFNPERHDKAQQSTRPTFSFIPFGGGPRICIASHLAMMQGVMITAMMMQQYEITLVEDHPVELDHFISLKPRHGIKVKLKKTVL